MGKLNGKVALVTGAADGIGATACRLLDAEGAAVVATDIDIERARALAATFANGGMALPLDVCDEQAWRTTIDATMAKYGRLDVLVNNAGGSGVGSIEDTTVEAYREAMRFNADSAFIGSKLAVEVMKATGGSIINVSSIHGIRASAYATAYSAAKGAMRLLTKAVALHCAQQGYRIRCNSVHPGYILTTQVKKWISESENPEALTKQLLAQHPIGFLGEPEDIANGILYLASDDSRFMTGSELVLDGGFTLV